MRRAVALFGIALLACDAELRFGGGDAAAPTTCDAGSCPLATQVCASGACVECNADSDCKVSGRPRCDLAGHVCVQCGATADCQPGYVCEPQTKRCLRGCASSSECTGEDYRDCDTLRGYCVACAVSSQCTGSDEHVCDQRTGQCVECLAAADCTHDPERGRCDPVSSRCVKCLTNADCTAGAPVCDPAGHECKSGS